MLKSRKCLIQENETLRKIISEKEKTIDHLHETIEYIKMYQSVGGEGNLPLAKEFYCKLCHNSIKHADADGGYVFLCTKNAPCKDFSPKR